MNTGAGNIPRPLIFFALRLLKNKFQNSVTTPGFLGNYMAFVVCFAASHAEKNISEQRYKS